MPCVVDAFAVIANVPGATVLAPFAGDVRTTDGAAAALTLMETGAEVVEVPLLPIAFAVNEYEPAATLAQLKLYGAVVSAPSSVAPL